MDSNLKKVAKKRISKLNKSISDQKKNNKLFNVRDNGFISKTKRKIAKIKKSNNL